MKLIQKKISCLLVDEKSNESSHDFLCQDAEAKATDTKDKINQSNNFIQHLKSKENSKINEITLEKVSLLSVFPKISKNNEITKVPSETNCTSDKSIYTPLNNKDDYLIEISLNIRDLKDNDAKLFFPKKLKQLIEYSIYILSKKNEEERQNLLFIVSDSKSNSSGIINECINNDYKQIFDYFEEKYKKINRSIIFLGVVINTPEELSEIKELAILVNKMYNEIKTEMKEINDRIRVLEEDK